MSEIDAAPNTGRPPGSDPDPALTMATGATAATAVETPFADQAPADPGALPSGDSPAPRSSDANWSKPVDRLTLGSVPAEAINLNVTGRRLSGPMQGFGQLWQKTYRIRMDGADVTPEQVVAVWKREFSSFWPKGARFYAPFAEIAPGEVGLINQDVPGRQVLSTGVMVIYADDVSFTFMTPEGHVFGALITFSAEREDDATVAQVQALLRASDPFYEVMLMTGGSAQENRHWQVTLTNLAARFGATGTPTMKQVCIDRKRQWRHVSNLRENAAIRSGLYMMSHPRALFRSRSGVDGAAPR
jgi:hypothetical protein